MRAAPLFFCAMTAAASSLDVVALEVALDFKVLLAVAAFAASAAASFTALATLAKMSSLLSAPAAELPPSRLRR
jgi:hypothetical protein